MPRMSNPGTKSRDDWETPDALIDACRREFLFGAPFGLDPCANAENKKADDWYGSGSPLCEDGLAVPWFGQSAYVNPPYGRGVIEKWGDSSASAGSRAGTGGRGHREPA